MRGLLLRGGKGRRGRVGMGKEGEEVRGG